MCSCSAIHHFWFSFVGLVAGIIGGAVFLGHFENLHAGMWSLASGTFALFCMHLHALMHKDKLDQYHTHKTLRALMGFGSMGIIASVVATLAYITLSIEHKIPLLPVKSSLYLGATQAVLTFKWCVALVHFARKYSAFLVNGFYEEI